MLHTLLFLRPSAYTTVLSSVQNYPFRVGASLDYVVPVNLPTSHILSVPTSSCRSNRT